MANTDLTASLPQSFTLAGGGRFRRRGAEAVVRRIAPRFDDVNKRFDDVHRELADQRERMAKLEGSLGSSNWHRSGSTIRSSDGW